MTAGGLYGKIMFLAGAVIVIFGAAYSLYSLWEEHTVTGRCFAAERKLEQHRFGMGIQEVMNLADKDANRKRSLELCTIEEGACFDGYATDIQDFCDAERAVQ